MSCDGTRPGDLAQELGISGKTLRAWLREWFPRDPIDLGSSWRLTHTQVTMARHRYGPTLPESGREHDHVASPPIATVPRGTNPAERSSHRPPAEAEVLDIEEVIGALSADPVDPIRARATPKAGGVPAVHGLYAWWTERGSVPGVPGNPHPRLRRLDLLYVGIAPKDASSASNLRKRVVSQHLSGNTGSSTLRLTLAALLLEPLHLSPVRTKKKVVLTREQNATLSAWQHDHLRVTWCPRSQPWLVEDEVIARMRPPLNLAGNTSHPFHGHLSAARKAFRQAASG